METDIREIEMMSTHCYECENETRHLYGTRITEGCGLKLPQNKFYNRYKNLWQANIALCSGCLNNCSECKDDGNPVCAHPESWRNE